jgi:beta-lactamase regulating signal transducer with metallopeptidase domain/ankyrin repeat protein
MIDAGIVQTLIVGHLWQSVALAAVLAATFIFGKRMRGATRYGLAGAALVASIVLPLSAFIPGESLARTVLDNLNAPPTIAEQPLAPAGSKPAPSFIEKTVADSGAPEWAINLGAQAMRAAAPEGSAKASETAWGKAAIAEGAPEWAINLGGEMLKSASKPVEVAPPPAAPMFTLPELKVPDFNLPDLTLPLAMVWIAGALILLTRTGRDLLAVERLVARSRPAELPEALKRRMNGVRVAVSSEAPGPMAAGLFRPCIVLPENVALSSPGMAALLEHERAHIQRRDMAVALAQRVMLALLWWSPALYWISRRIDEEREVACDEAAVERTGDARAFARSLTSQAENQLWARAPRLAVGAIGPRSHFGRRIKRLIEIAKGASPAKYSGRLAFAGLALAVAVAAMVTPRIAADAQQPGTLPPVDETLDGRPLDLVSPQEPREPRELREAQESRETRDAVREAIRGRNFADLDDLNNEELALLGDDISKMMEDLSKELEVSLAGLSPEIQADLHGLSGEMAALGVEISQIVSQEVLNEMPGIMEEVRRALDEAGIDVGDFDTEEVRQAIQEAREELHEKLGPEMREEIRAAIQEARDEVAAHRDEIEQAVKESHAGMAIAHQAIAQARAEIEAARARGDFDKYKEFKGKDGAWNFDFDPATIKKLKESGLKYKEAAEKAKIERVRAEAGSPSQRLYRAAGRCNDDEVKRLITEDKADMNTVIRGDGTPLIVAARRGCTDTVRMLLDAGANPNLASPGDGNPLIAAAARGNMDIVRLLLDRGANANAYAAGDGNPLIAAAQHDKIDVARLLVERGANVNGFAEGDETPLMNAAEQGHLDMVKFLVERGAKVNLAYWVERWGNQKELRSPLNMAQKYDHDDVAAYLRSKGAVAEPKAAN